MNVQPSGSDVELALVHVVVDGESDDESDGESADDDVRYQQFVFDVTNRGEEPLAWRLDAATFVGDDGYQYNPEANVSNSDTVPSDTDRTWQTSVDIVPDATARCVVDVTVPTSVTVERLVVDTEDRLFEVPFESLDIDEAAVAPETFEESTTVQVSSTADGTAFEVELVHIVTGAGDDDDVTLLAFEVTNVGNETKQWWYDEHTFIDEDGYQTTELGDVHSTILSADIDAPGWETNPKIQPGATVDCITDAVVDGPIETVAYEYLSEEYHIRLDEQLREELRVDYDTFLREYTEESGSTSSSLDTSDDDSEKEDETDDVPDELVHRVVDENTDVSYEDIGGLDEQIKQVQEAVQLPLTESELFSDIGIEPASGLLLSGPPGTGKTMIARAVANETDATFIRIVGSELARRYVGEGADFVQKIFAYARREAPAILFLDEIDAIATARREESDGGTEGVYRTMLQLVSEMDGFEKDADVRVIAATNRRDRLDDAILRPGRFDRIVEVPKPDVEGRREVLSVLTADMRLADDVDLHEVADRAESMSGADLSAVCTEAGYYAIRDDRTEITQVDLLTGVQTVADRRSDEQPRVGQ
jgi:26S proteasome subunit P45 family